MKDWKVNMINVSEPRMIVFMQDVNDDDIYVFYLQSIQVHNEGVESKNSNMCSCKYDAMQPMYKKYIFHRAECLHKMHKNEYNSLFFYMQFMMK